MLRCFVRRAAGQATVMVALALPAFMAVTMGVIELGNVYYQAAALQRATESAARSVAELASAADLAQPYPPPWMAAVAAAEVERSLGTRVEGVSVSWASPEDTGTSEGEEIRFEVQIPEYGEGNTVLRWGDPHTYSYRRPAYSTEWRSATYRPGFWYLDQAVYPGWYLADLTHTHGYGDNAVWDWWSQQMWGYGYGKGLVFDLVCGKVCYPKLIPVRYHGVAVSYNPFVADAWTSDASRSMGGNWEGAWIPLDWESLWWRRSSTDPFTHWERWLSEASWVWENGISQPNPQSAVVGTYAVYTGDVPRQATAQPRNPSVVRRAVMVSATVRLRAVTPAVGAFFDRLPVTRSAVYDVTKRM